MNKNDLKEYEVICLEILITTMEREAMIDPMFENVQGQEDYREGVRAGYIWALSLIEEYKDKIQND